MAKQLRPIILVLFSTLIFSLSSPAVVVYNITDLENAVSTANSGGDKQIYIANGTYTLSDALVIRGNGITIQSLSGNRSQVTLQGTGMYGGVTHIFQVEGSNFTAKNMTIGWVANHAIQIHGELNADHPVMSNLRIVDTYEQIVKVSYSTSSSNTSDNGILENCLLEYSAGVGPQYYIGGIDGHKTKGWIVRNNTFRNIISPGGDVAEHAIHFWSDARDTLAEGNLIINCDRGIGFGLGDRGHHGGIIRNNMIVNTTDGTLADVGIGLENASNVQVCNNTVYFSHTYPNAIEYRFSGTYGGIIANNLCNKSITSRNGGTATVFSNNTSASPGWFVNVSSANLHLSYAVTSVVDKGALISTLTTDYDGDPRPQRNGMDIGADEYSGAILKDDVLASWENSDVWYQNANTGLWVKMSPMASQVDAGNLNRDGADDLIGVWGSGLWVKYSISGTWSKLAASLPLDIASGDMNGDGSDDVLATWSGSGVWYWDSLGGGWVKMSSAAYQVAAGDVDGDYTDDLIGVWSSGLWVLYSSTGTWERLASSRPSCIACGDMNGDGRDDVLGSWSGTGVWYRNSLGGGWVKMSIPAILVAAGDTDGDHTADLIGVWASGLWIKSSMTGSWEQLAISPPKDISAGKLKGGAW
jgi:hypothetical protein